MDPIERLVDDTGDPPLPLPPELERLYGGPFTLAPDVVYANFVSTVDGVAAIPEAPRSSALISGGADADRFVVGLLRASADVVLVGAGTVREHARTLWVAENAYRSLATAYRELRKNLGHNDDPALAVVTASGKLDPEHPALQRRALVLTTSDADLSLPATCEIVRLGGGALDGHTIRAALRERGFRRILTEGGPSLMGTLLEAGVLDELFLTVAASLGGRSAGNMRPGVVDELTILPDARLPLTLRTLGRAGSYLLTRYAIGLREEVR